MGHIGRISQIRRIRPILLSLLLAAFALSATAAEWPRFRGPNGTGQGGAVELPDHWTDADFHWRDRKSVV